VGEHDKGCGRAIVPAEELQLWSLQADDESRCDVRLFIEQRCRMMLQRAAAMKAEAGSKKATDRDSSVLFKIVTDQFM
jgi:hypothetical protein